MRRIHPLLMMTGTAAFFFAAACTSGRAISPFSNGGSEGRTAEEIEALYLARIDSAQARYTAADVRFMTDMLAHHAQAIEMAELATDRTSDPSMRTLAGRVINAQRDEIDTMRRWLQDRGEPIPDIDLDHAVHSGMPGMIGPDEMARLEQSRDTDFDRLFLALMIRHHEGAVEMVETLFLTAGAGQDEEVFKFASDVQVDQRTEIARMERMLEALSGPIPAR